MIQVRVNGENRTTSAGTLMELLRQELGSALERRGIAVAVNGEVVPRSRWKEHPLCAGDQIEVIRPVQGGLTPRELPPQGAL